MRHVKWAVMCLAVSLALVPSLWAQRMGMGARPPMWGLVRPEVGSGAEYQMITKEGTRNITYAVVGKEMVDGHDGYWLEWRFDAGQQGKMITKVLMVFEKDQVQTKRMIMQMDGRPPMEMPTGMMGMARAQTSKNISSGEKVGSEMVTVPGGTFLCDHYRNETNGTTTDAWVSPKVPVFGLVKSASPHVTMVLVKTLDHQTSEIQGEPQKMPMFPH